MSEKPKHANRIPHESLADNAVVSPWSLPTVDKKSRLVFSAKRERAVQDKSDRGDGELVEDYKGPLKPKPLTAEQLRQLTEEAKKEGFDQGYNQGLQRGLQEGTARGFEEGETKAYQNKRQALEEEIARLAAISAHLFAPMEHQRDALEAIVVEMAINFAQEIVDRELDQAPTLLLDIVKTALAALPAGAKNIVVYTNADDAALIEKYLPNKHRNWTMMADDSIARGGCRVETEESLVDYSVEQRLLAFLQQVRAQVVDESVKTPPPRDPQSETPRNKAPVGDARVNNENRPASSRGDEGPTG